MPKQNVREMSRFQLVRHSLGAKMFRVVLLLTIIIGVAATIVGFLLYSSSVRREYKSVAWNIAKTATAVLDKDKSSTLSNALLKRYESIPEEELAGMDSVSLLDYFDDLLDADFVSLRAKLHDIQMENEAESVYLAALDTEHNRMIYLVDSDYSDTFCPPGMIDELSQEEIDAYLAAGSEQQFNSYLMGDKTVPAYIFKSQEFGYLCTAGDQMFAAIKGYPIYIFTDLDMESVAALTRQFLFSFVGGLLLITILLCLIATFYIKRKVTNPINTLASAAESYILNKKSSAQEQTFFENLNIRTGDEIENLSMIMRDMEIDISEYEKNITEITAEKERINTELSIGKLIQESMVPHIYPPYPERPEFDIYATMTPAKEIGGDFYDFFLIDPDHLALVMADVSGKGIPAALFMMASKILLKNTATFGNQSPAKTLELVNNEICENNQAEMFVTIWLGVIEISTGIMKCANAGHEYPAICRKDGSYELYKDPHGFVIGGMEGMKYKEYELRFSPGDRLFVYTDGVTEAADKEERLFGTDRMIEALNAKPDASEIETLENMHEHIRAFVKDADQFDDITMMSFIYNGTEQS